MSASVSLMSRAPKLCLSAELQFLRPTGFWAALLGLYLNALLGKLLMRRSCLHVPWSRGLEHAWSILCYAFCLPVSPGPTPVLLCLQ